MTPQRRLLAFKLSILSLAVLSVAAGSTALVLHSNNGMFTSSNEFTNCTAMPTNKISNISVLLLVTVAELCAGIFFGLCLSVLMIGWLLRRESHETAAPMKFRVPSYLFAALALLSTSLAFGYYSSFSLDDLRVGCLTVLVSTYPQIILLGSSTLLLLICLILCLTLPKTSTEDYYQEKMVSEIELPKRSAAAQDEVIKIKLNDQSINHYVISKQQQQQQHEETSDELHNKLGNNLLPFPSQNEAPSLGRKSESLSMQPWQTPANTYVAPPHVPTPVPPQIKVPTFDERKMQIVRQYRQSPMHQPRQDNQSPSPVPAGPRPMNSPTHQSPMNTQGKMYQEEVSPINDFLSKHRPTHRPPSPIDFLPPQQPAAYPRRQFDEVLEPAESPPRNQVPGLVRSRKRIFDRTNEKQTYLRNELRNKYGMK